MKILLKNKYFLNTYWLLSEKIIRLSFTIFTISMLARYLGPTDLGKYNYVQTFIAIFGVFVTLGMEALIVQEILRRPKEVNKLLGSVFFLKLCSTLVALLLITLITYIFDFDKEVSFGIIILSISLLLQNFSLIELHFQAIVKSKFTAIANFITLVIGTAIKIWLIFTKAELYLFFYTLLLESVILFVTSLFFYSKIGHSVYKWRPSKKKMIEIFRKSLPFIVSSFSVIIYMKIDQIMIQEMLDYESLGYYSAALRLSETWFFVPIAISASFYPSLVNSHKNKGDYKKRFQLLYDGIFMIALVLALLTMIISAPLISILYGESYAASSTILSLQIWATFFVFIGVANSKWFILFEKQKILMWITVLSCILNILLNYFLINKFGIVGAAVATVIASSFSAFFGMLLFYKSCKENIFLTLRSFNIFKSIPRAIRGLKSNEKIS